MVICLIDFIILLFFLSRLFPGFNFFATSLFVRRVPAVMIEFPHCHTSPSTCPHHGKSPWIPALTYIHIRPCPPLTSRHALPLISSGSPNITAADDTASTTRQERVLHLSSYSHARCAIRAAPLSTSVSISATAHSPISDRSVPPPSHKGLHRRSPYTRHIGRGVLALL